MSGQSPDQPHFATAAVLGVGLIGASFALAAKAAGLVDRVIGVARREETRRIALDRGAADEVTDDPVAAVAEADLVYLSVPVGVMDDMLAAMAPALRAGTLITDAASVKAHVCRAAEAVLPPTVAFVGGHPMAGSERSGPEAAREHLFRGHAYFLVPTSLGGDEALAKVACLVDAIGGVPSVVDASLHDHLVAATSHLPHAVAMALSLAVAELVPDHDARVRFTGSGLRDTTRIAASSPEVWRDIFLANAAEVVAGCRSASASLDALAEAIATGDADRLTDLLRDARAARLSLDAGRDRP
jgi:prephenate dehydrogenase